MKISGLKGEDFTNIESAFEYYIGDQLLRSTEYAQDGKIEACECYMDEARCMIGTYRKIRDAEEGYLKKEGND